MPFLHDHIARVTALDVHRDRISSRIFPFNACVAQPISRKDVARIPAAKAAMKIEWDRLFGKKVWDIASVME